MYARKNWYDHTETMEGFLLSKRKFMTQNITQTLKR
ncbi:hypothetical protein B0I21_10432 [Sphingobacterium paludis]|uniref:Uncharacterized protein n=1 Tax=Sphingobacterium paludis TaxID=1476465 RepID=A0A4R7D4B6_9SPHI|nr:hypothetical protein B0I21_10432 [Sphingobacterium paludis]